MKETAEVARSLHEELPPFSDGRLGEHERSEMMPDVTEAEDADKILVCTGPMRSENDTLLERMQAPEVRAAARRAFNASPNELREAAMEAARNSEGCLNVRP